MISQEFKNAINEKNLLMSRILIKGSFIIDPTFSLLNEMLSYAKKNLPEIWVEYDGIPFENDSSKWNQEVMDMELVQLVNNFSDDRIDHLKKVASVVLATEIANIKAKRNADMAKPSIAQPSLSDEQRAKEKRRALGQALVECRKIGNIAKNVEDNGMKWTPKGIEEAEQSAKQILIEINKYRIAKTNN